MVISNRAALHPLPMRITRVQIERLHAARERDGTSIQEHVRRALDIYLDMLDKRMAKLNPQAEVAADVPGADSPKKSPPSAAADVDAGSRPRTAAGTSPKPRQKQPAYGYR